MTVYNIVGSITASRIKCSPLVCSCYYICFIYEMPESNRDISWWTITKYGWYEPLSSSTKELDALIDKLFTGRQLRHLAAVVSWFRTRACCEGTVLATRQSVRLPSRASGMLQPLPRRSRTSWGNRDDHHKEDCRVSHNRRWWAVWPEKIAKCRL